MSTARIEMFSDGVFAIAITLLVLEIQPPEDTHRLAHELGELWPSYVAYVVSFLLIGLVWANHHTMFQHSGPIGYCSSSTCCSCWTLPSFRFRRR